MARWDQNIIFDHYTTCCVCWRQTQHETQHIGGCQRGHLYSVGFLAAGPAEKYWYLGGNPERIRDDLFYGKTTTPNMWWMVHTNNLKKNYVNVQEWQKSVYGPQIIQSLWQEMKTAIHSVMMSIDRAWAVLQRRTRAQLQWPEVQILCRSIHTDSRL